MASAAHSEAPSTDPFRWIAAAQYPTATGRLRARRVSSLARTVRPPVIAEAKAKFSELVAKAQSDGPQTITRRGRAAVVVVAAEEWNRKTKRVGNLAEFFASSPLRGSGTKLTRRNP